MIFSANQRSKANSTEYLALLNMGKSINIMERECKPFIRTEKNVDTIRNFLEILLRFGNTIDVLLKKTINKLKWKGILGKNKIILRPKYESSFFTYVYSYFLLYLGQSS